MSRLPVSQRYKRCEQRWKRYEKQRHGHQLQIAADPPPRPRRTAHYPRRPADRRAARPAVRRTTGVHLRTGDTLLLYSDGLTEARTYDRVRYDEEELRDFADTLDTSNATDTVAAVTQLLDSFGDGGEDDTALLALSVCPPGDERS